MILQLSSIEPSSILYLFGLLFGILSVVYFAKDILLSLSITVKTYSLYVLSSLIFSVSLFFTDSVLYLLLIVLSGVSYTVSVAYTWNKSPIGRTGRFVLLLLSSALFVGIAAGVQNNIFTLNKTVSASIPLVLFVVFILLSVFDIRESSPVTWKTDFDETIDVQDSTDVGKIEIQNDGNFTREYEIPTISVVYVEDGDEYDIPVRVTRNGQQTVGRNGSESLNITCEFARYTDSRSDVDTQMSDQLVFVEMRDETTAIFESE